MDAYVSGGGGFVASGWVPWWLALDHPAGGIEMVLPFAKGTDWLSGGAITVLSGHPITEGVGNFANPDDDNFGGGPKVGATVLG